MAKEEADILRLARQTPSIDRRIRSGETVNKSAGWTGQTLFGKTLGVIGKHTPETISLYLTILGGGNIGLLAAKMFHGAFQGDIILYDPYLRSLDTWHSVIPPTHVHLVTDLDDLLMTSDIVTIHVPLTPATQDMIGAKQFKTMKSSAILINTARGGIVNEKDLADALSREEIFAAGLDAFVSEPPTLSQYPELCQSDRVLLL
jgi:D-3-phosphoglycerate dehydrogenase